MPGLTVLSICTGVLDLPLTPTRNNTWSPRSKGRLKVRKNPALQ